MKRGLSTIKRNKSVVIGLICGVCCALCVGIYVDQVDKQASAAQAEMLARYGGEQIEVCVAKRDIAAGQSITEGDIETKMWIATMLPANAVTSKTDAVGQKVGSAILAGEVISSSRFGTDSESIQVPDGLCAISVPARDVQAVGGALASGMKVDVYAVGGNSTAKIASSIPVLETCDSTGSSSSNTWVTLAVEPSKVEEMVVAAENLQLYFVLPSANMNSGMQLEANGKDSAALEADGTNSDAQSGFGANNSSALDGSASSKSQTDGESRSDSTEDHREDE